MNDIVDTLHEVAGSERDLVSVVMYDAAAEIVALRAENAILRQRLEQNDTRLAAMRAKA